MSPDRIGFALGAVLTACVIAFCGGCPSASPTPTPPPVPSTAPSDASPAPDDLMDGSIPVDAPATPALAASACVTMRRLGCVEGTDPQCATVLLNIADAGRLPINIGRIVVAKSKSDVHAGGIACP